MDVREILDYHPPLNVDKYDLSSRRATYQHLSIPMKIHTQQTTQFTRYHYLLFVGRLYGL